MEGRLCLYELFSQVCFLKLGLRYYSSFPHAAEFMSSSLKAIKGITLVSIFAISFFVHILQTTKREPR